MAIGKAWTVSQCTACRCGHSEAGFVVCCKGKAGYKWGDECKQLN